MKNFVGECGKAYYIECDEEKGVAVWWNIEDELVTIQEYMEFIESRVYDMVEAELFIKYQTLY